MLEVATLLPEDPGFYFHGLRPFFWRTPFFLLFHLVGVLHCKHESSRLSSGLYWLGFWLQGDTFL